MKKGRFFVLQSIFLIFAVGLIVSCDGLDDMNSSYQNYYEEIIEKRREEAEKDKPEYEPGEYWLAALLDDNYDVVYNSVSSRIKARDSFEHYEWWLSKSTGEVVAWSAYDDDDVLDDYGDVMGLGHVLLLTNTITGVATTKGSAKDSEEDDDVSHKTDDSKPVQGNDVNELGDAPYIVRCQAKNSLGDVYWDTATLYVVIPEDDETGEETE